MRVVFTTITGMAKGIFTLIVCVCVRVCVSVCLCQQILYSPRTTEAAYKRYLPTSQNYASLKIILAIFLKRLRSSEMP